MAKRATKRGEKRTDLGGSRDLLICGASFAGLMVARQMAGSGADVLLLDRYEIGERQTSACAMPTDWLRNLGLIGSEKQRFDRITVHTAHGSVQVQAPLQFSTFDYRTLCDLLWQGCDATFETAKVNGRADFERAGEERTADGPIAIETDRGVISAPLVVDAMGWKRVLANGSTYRPPDAPLSRGLEVHPGGASDQFEIWIDRRYLPAGYGWSFPADDEVRVGVGSFDPREPVRPPTDRLADDIPVDKDGYQGNWIPHKLRPATGGGVFFAGDSAGHCLPVTAEGIRPAFYFGAALGLELKAVSDGHQTRDHALRNYAAFNDRHQPQFEALLRIQKALPKIHPRLVKPFVSTALGPLGGTTLGRYFGLMPPEFAEAATPTQAKPVPAAPGPIDIIAINARNGSDLEATAGTEHRF